MSRIGIYNLELQEQANEYGFETTQEALQGGFTIKDDKLCPPEPTDPVESLLDGLDEVISYLREELDDDCERTKKMIEYVLRAERHINERR